MAEEKVNLIISKEKQLIRRRGAINAAKMPIKCIQKLCCFPVDDTPDLDLKSRVTSETGSVAETTGKKLDKIGSRGSVSEEDSGVGSEGIESDIADQSLGSDAESRVHDVCAQEMPSIDQDKDQPEACVRRSESTLSRFSNILPEDKDLSDMLAEEFQANTKLNGFSVFGENQREEGKPSIAFEVVVAEGEDATKQTNNPDKKLKRKKRKNRGQKDQ